MKTFIWIIIIIAVLGGSYLYTTSKKQDAEIAALPQAELSDTENTNSAALEGDVVVLTQTSAGLTQENAETAPIQFDTTQTFVRFTGYKVGGEHVGSFDTMRAEVIVKEGSILGGTLTIDAASVKTDDVKVDQHLQTADFLDVAVYPEIKFVVNNVMFNDMDQTALLKGSLTLHGVTKEITAPITVLANGIATDFTISLKEFGIEYPVVKDEVRIESQIVLKK